MSDQQRFWVSMQKVEKQSVSAYIQPCDRGPDDWYQWYLDTGRTIMLQGMEITPVLFVYAKVPENMRDASEFPSEYGVLVIPMDEVDKSDWPVVIAEFCKATDATGMAFAAASWMSDHIEEGVPPSESKFRASVAIFALYRDVQDIEGGSCEAWLCPYELDPEGNVTWCGTFESQGEAKGSLAETMNGNIGPK